MIRRSTSQGLALRPLLSRPAAAWLLVAIVVLVIGPLGAAPARASGTGVTAEGMVPADVRAQFEGQPLRKGIATPETDRLVEVRAGTIHQLFTYTSDFAAGSTTAAPVEPMQEWVAGIEGDGAPIGWLRVWKPDGGPAAPTGWNPHPPSGAAMLASTASALVEVPWDAAFFTLVDGVATPVVVSQRDEGLRPRSLVEVQRALAQQRAAYEDCGEGCGGGGNSGSPPPWVGADGPTPSVWAGVTALLVVVGGAVALLWRRRERGGHRATSWS